MLRFLSVAVFWLLHLPLSMAIFERNEIKGTPIVECHEDTVVLLVKTEQQFDGNIFVKGKSNDPQCFSRYDKNAENGATFVVHLGRCGMQRLRSANPRGMNFMITVVVSFHPLFITKPDRAYHIKCFYMEPDEIVTSNLEVSQLPTTPLYDSMAMPTCEYTVRLGTPDGKLLRFANIGDRVYHVWECQGPDMGIVVKACSVGDGRGAETKVVDYDGCSLDSQLLSQLTYDKSLMRAYASSDVFKYADRNTLFFTCQITLCQKMLDMCRGVTPPNCAKVADAADSSSEKNTFTKRSVPTIELDGYNRTLNETQKALLDWSSGATTIDVATAEFLVLDVDNGAFLNDTKDRFLETIESPFYIAPPASEYPIEQFAHGERMCLSNVGLAISLIVLVLMMAVTAVSSILCYRVKYVHLPIEEKLVQNSPSSPLPYAHLYYANSLTGKEKV